jgi:YD repeat-containing protein
MASATVTEGHTATFDTLGRKLTDVGGMGQTTTFAYDSNGNVSSIKDALSNNTVQHFDALNRLMNYVEPSPTGASYLTLDAHDRLLSFETPGGETITYVSSTPVRSAVLYPL